ncbi:hypothetical protein KAJ89_04750 [Candidatus Parcubacteria bacterium]|nr:hypothetical protein [Candidatus Parcubacteria bacterium]
MANQEVKNDTMLRVDNLIQLADYQNKKEQTKARHFNQIKQVVFMEEENSRVYSGLAKRRQKEEAIEMELLKVDELKNKIRDARFDGGVFYAILLLSVAKDLIDVLTLGIAGTIANFFIVPLLFIISLLRGTRIKSKLIKRFIIPMVFETIIGWNIIPWYTLTTLILKLMADYKVKELSAELRKVQKNLKKI